MLSILIESPEEMPYFSLILVTEEKDWSLSMHFPKQTIKRSMSAIFCQLCIKKTSKVKMHFCNVYTVECFIKKNVFFSFFSFTISAL